MTRRERKTRERTAVVKVVEPDKEVVEADTSYLDEIPVLMVVKTELQQALRARLKKPVIVSFDRIADRWVLVVRGSYLKEGVMWYKNYPVTYIVAADVATS